MTEAAFRFIDREFNVMSLHMLAIAVKLEAYNWVGLNTEVSTCVLPRVLQSPAGFLKSTERAYAALSMYNEPHQSHQ